MPYHLNHNPGKGLTILIDTMFRQHLRGSIPNGLSTELTPSSARFKKVPGVLILIIDIDYKFVHNYTIHLEKCQYYLLGFTLFSFPFINLFIFALCKYTTNSAPANRAKKERSNPYLYKNINEAIKHESMEAIET